MRTPPEALELQDGGALDSRKHIYIERRADAEFLRLLDQGEYVNLLVARQMGKTSLVMRAIPRLVQAGVRPVYIDVAAELGSQANAESWYRDLLRKVVRGLQLDIDVNEWWSESEAETHNQHLIDFFSEVILRTVPEPERIIVFLDEIDSTLKLTYTDDFFVAIRGMYSRRSLEPAFARLSFCLIGVAAPDELIRDERTTPYNVGRTIELADFDPARDDLLPLVHVLAPDAARGQAVLDRILHWTGGHPYLTLRVCRLFLDEQGSLPSDVDALIETRYRRLEELRTDVHFGRIDRFLKERVAEPAETLALYERILQGRKERDAATLRHTQLKLSGIVKRDADGCLAVHNLIYARIFDLGWVRATRPRRTVRRLRLVLAAVLVVAIVSSAYGIYLQKVVAPQQEEATRLAATIRSTPKEDVARESFERLLALREWPLPGSDRKDFRAEAVRAYRDFWLSRAQSIEQRALGQVAAGNLEEGLLLGALAARKRNGDLHPKVRAAAEPLLDLLEITFRESDGRPSTRRIGYGGEALCAALSPDETRVVTTNENVARLWERATGRPLLMLSGHEESVRSAMFSPDGTRIVTASFDDSAWIWDAKSGNKVLRLAAKDDINFAAFSPDGTRLVTAQDDHSARLWDARTARELLTFTGHTGKVIQAMFSNDGTRVVTASHDQTVRIWDSRSGKELERITMPGSVYAAAISPDDRHILAVGDAEDLTQVQAALWDLRAKSRPLWTGKSPHGGEVLSAFSPDGRWVVSGVIVREVATGRTVLKLPLPLDEGISTAGSSFSSDGRRILTASDDAVRLWNISRLLAPSGGDHSPAESSVERWSRWQTKLGLTVNELDEVVPLWPTGPHAVDGLDLNLIDNLTR